MLIDAALGVGLMLLFFAIALMALLRIGNVTIVRCEVCRKWNPVFSFQLKALATREYHNLVCDRCDASLVPPVRRTRTFARWVAMAAVRARAKQYNNDHAKES
jgi:hypothetical protein